MTTLLTSPASVLSRMQRRCHLLLMLYLPGQVVTPERVARLTGVDEAQALQDIADTGDEIQCHHRLSLIQQHDGSYRIEGTILNCRLGLLHALRRSLRLCPQFVQHSFSPALKTQLNRLGIIKALYDETNLRALIHLCAHRLQQQYNNLDYQLLTLFLPYCLLQHHCGLSPDISLQQHQWNLLRPEFYVAQEITCHWQRRMMQPIAGGEQHFLALLFQLLRTPDPLHDRHPQDEQLRDKIALMIARFQKREALSFHNKQALRDQLYIHLTQALHRSQFAISTARDLQDEVTRLYPRLMRTVREVLGDIGEYYRVTFSDADVGKVAVIFGAWLMQENTIQEKQVLLLTGNDPALEQQIEEQIRELTLLPFTLNYLPVKQFQDQGAPRDTALVVTPYATSFPLFSPPLIHTTMLLNDSQLQWIKALLDA